MASSNPKITRRLLTDLRTLIDTARGRVAQAVNAGLVVLYWQVGRRIRQDILQNKRAEYGEQIVHAMSAQLMVEYGRGFTRDNLFRMVQFSEMYPDSRIVGTLSRQLGWSHFVRLITVDDPLARDFYGEMSRVEKWSVRTLRAKIGGMLYERVGLSKKPRV